MRIAILDLTTHSEPLLSGVPTAGELIERWLGPDMAGDDLTIHAVAQGAPMPGPDAFDGLLVSGSEKGVYDPTPWMADLRALLLATRDVGKPIFGICFGHQIMADTFGGRAELTDIGVQVGARTFAGAVGDMSAYVWHQDQVTEVPPGATVTLSAPYCPVGALAYDFAAQSVQFHPEYDPPAMTALFERGRDLFIEGALADGAIASFAQVPVAERLMARDAARFFHDAHSARD